MDVCNPKCLYNKEKGGVHQSLRFHRWYFDYIFHGSTVHFYSYLQNCYLKKIYFINKVCSFINHLTITCCFVMLSSSRPAALFLSVVNHFEHFALKPLWQLKKLHIDRLYQKGGDLDWNKNFLAPQDFDLGLYRGM